MSCFHVTLFCFQRVFIVLTTPIWTVIRLSSFFGVEGGREGGGGRGDRGDWSTTNFLEMYCYFPVIRMVNFVQVAPVRVVTQNRRAFCMRTRQYGLLKCHKKCHRGIFCELFTFSTSICGLFSGSEWRVLGVTFHKRVLQRIVIFLRWKWVYCTFAVAVEGTVFPFVKQYIEGKMAAECSYDLTFSAHFLSRRKRSVW